MGLTIRQSCDSVRINEGSSPFTAQRESEEIYGKVKKKTNLIVHIMRSPANCRGPTFDFSTDAKSFFEVLLASVSSFVVNSSCAIPTEQWRKSSINSFMFQTAAVAVAFVPR